MSTWGDTASPLYAEVDVSVHTKTCRTLNFINEFVPERSEYCFIESYALFEILNINAYVVEYSYLPLSETA